MDQTEARILIPRDISSARSGAFRKDWRIASFSGETMGTTWAVKLAIPPEINTDPLPDLISQELQSVVQQMSPWESDSDLRRFQKAAPGEWVSFREKSFTVLKRALELAKLSDGRYDPTYAQAIDLLGFGPSPSKHLTYNSPEVLNAFTQSGYYKLLLDPATSSVRQPGFLGIDLCSIAKGFAVDRVFETLIENGIENLCAEIGGETRGLGCKPDGSPWLFTLDRPDGGQLTTHPGSTQVALCDLALATSGNYLMYCIVDGQPIGHLVDRRKARDSSKLLSVSVLSKTCIDADGLATALYLMGETEGLAFSDHHSIASIFLTASGELLSNEAKRMLA